MATRFHTRYAVTLVTELPRYKNYVTRFCFKKKYVNVICGSVAQEKRLCYKQFRASRGESKHWKLCVRKQDAFRIFSSCPDYILPQGHTKCDITPSKSQHISIYSSIPS